VTSSSDATEWLLTAIGVYVEPERKAPWLAVILSVFCAGLGQLYNGQIVKGIFIVVAYMISAILIAVLIGIVTTPIIWLWSVADAYATATSINNRVAQLRMRCPLCAEVISDLAVVCPYCGYAFPPPEEQSPPSAGGLLLPTLGVTIGLLCAASAFYLWYIAPHDSVRQAVRGLWSTILAALRPSPLDVSIYQSEDLRFARLESLISCGLGYHPSIADSLEGIELSLMFTNNGPDYHKIVSWRSIARSSDGTVWKFPVDNWDSGARALFFEAIPPWSKEARRYICIPLWTDPIRIEPGPRANILNTINSNTFTLISVEADFGEIESPLTRRRAEWHELWPALAIQGPTPIIPSIATSLVPPTRTATLSLAVVPIGTHTATATPLAMLSPTVVPTGTYTATLTPASSPVVTPTGTNSATGTPTEAGNSRTTSTPTPVASATSTRTLATIVTTTVTLGVPLPLVSPQP
jgi:TM2 domain-containing membrane protein YozV